MKDWDAFVKFIEKVKAGALATVDGDRPQVRAVVFVPLGEEGIIYTTTDCKSKKISQIRKNPNVSLFIWKERKFFRGEGKAEISEDLDLKRKILEKHPEWIRHYPLGPEDPCYCLIKIRVSKLEKE
jgi:uncharacterized pyridoxamine 5'-phosphate oxidase family protein